MSKSWRDKPTARRRAWEEAVERGSHRKMDPYRRSKYKNYDDSDESYY